jgi:hypothetical protein
VEEFTIFSAVVKGKGLSGEQRVFLVKKGESMVLKQAKPVQRKLWYNASDVQRAQWLKKT